MQYGININFFARDIGMEKAAEWISKAGFTMLDYTPPVMEDDWASRMKDAMEIFDANGLTVHQTHAPFNRYGRYGDKHRLCVDRCAEATEYMGAEFMVVHGDEFDFANLTFSPEAALTYNHDYFLPYVQHAGKSGYKVAFETVFEDWDRRRYTSREEELLALITSYKSECAVCCWDFGHGNVTFVREAPQVIERFGSLIQCTHVHDNTGRDSHQMPLTGDINWKETIAAFKKIGYAGVMSVEYSHGHTPEALAEAFIDLTCKMTKYAWEA